MKDIRIFVASSKELIAERNQLAFLVLSMEEEFAARGLRVRLSKWEYVDPKMTEERTEDRYLEEMYASDAAFVLFKTLIGKYTREETEKALAREQSGCSRLKTHRILFKDGDGEPTPELASWRAGLADGEYGTFSDFDGLKAEFLALVDRLVELDASDTVGKHLQDTPPDSHMRRITAFLAADDELAADRDAFADTVLNLNDLLEFRNLRVQLRFCPTGLSRDAVQSLVSTSEMGLVLYGSNVRAFDRAAMDDVADRTRRGENPKKLYVFFRDDSGAKLSDEFVAFRDSFVERLGHFVCQFGGPDSLRLSFLLSLERYAGETVEIYSTVSAPTASVFVGRENELRKLHDLLVPTNTFPAGRLPIVTGAGGTGKSELVRQYVSQFRVQYPGGVFQVDMESCKTWDDAFLGILKGTPNNGVKVSEILGLDAGKGEPVNLDGAAVRDALLQQSRKAGPILLVLDNVEGCADLLGEENSFAQAFPAGFSEKVQVNVVATARTCDATLGENDWPQLFALGDLSSEAALELMDSEKKAETAEEKAAAKRVAELLGCRALFLRRVPAILKGMNKKARIVCRTYVRLAEMLEKDSLGAIGKTGTVDSSYMPSRLWEIVQGNLAEWGLGDACIKLAKIASYFSPDGFSKQLLRYLWDKLVYPGLEDWGEAGEVFDQAVDLLKNYNIFQSTDPVRIHRLDRAAILATAKAEPGLEDALGVALADYGRLLKEDWAFLFEHEKLRAHLPEALVRDGDFWPYVIGFHPGFAEACPWDSLTGGALVAILSKQPQFSDRCNWAKLRGSDWVKLLCDQPQLADRCPWTRFTSGEWSRLLRVRPQFSDQCSWTGWIGTWWVGLLLEQPQLADHCEWKSLRGMDWCRLLKAQPQFADRCDWEKLDGREGMCWVSLLRERPQFSERCPWKDLDGKGWSRLLAAQPQFADLCAWDKLDGADWGTLVAQQLQFEERCPAEKHDGSYWSRLLKKHPQFADDCPWESFDGKNWCMLLGAQPQFADKCSWERLDGGDWDGLLCQQPQFSKYCDWARLDEGNWCALLRHQPQFARYCDWNKLFGYWRCHELLKSNPHVLENVDLKDLSGASWSMLLAHQPQFADSCDWTKLSGSAWGKLLSVQPQFAEYCAWGKLDGDDWSLLLSVQTQFVDKCPWFNPLENEIAVNGDCEDWLLPVAVIKNPSLLEDGTVAARFDALLACEECGSFFLDDTRSSVFLTKSGGSVGVNPWAYVLYFRPELAERCTVFEKFSGLSRCRLLAKHPQFAEYWAMDELADLENPCWANLEGSFENAWRHLIRLQPQFAKWREGK